MKDKHDSHEKEALSIINGRCPTWTMITDQKWGHGRFRGSKTRTAKVLLKYKLSYHF